MSSDGILAIFLSLSLSLASYISLPFYVFLSRSHLDALWGSDELEGDIFIGVFGDERCLEAVSHLPVSPTLFSLNHERTIPFYSKQTQALMENNELFLLLSSFLLSHHLIG